MYSNVSVFVLLALLASAMGGITKEEMEADKQKCIAETGIDPALLKGPPAMDGPVDEKLKCFGACLIKQRGGFKADGTLDLDKAIAAVPADVPAKDKIVDALTACADKKGANECETAFEIAKCLHEQKMPLMA